MRWGRFTPVLLLLNCLLLVGPLAASSPPDPLWIPGIYDVNDFDDVVEALAFMEGKSERHALWSVRPLLIARGSSVMFPAAIPSRIDASALKPRAPPSNS
jgi:hypothetical protein